MGRGVHSVRNILALLAATVLAAACSGSPETETYFETKGLRAPSGACNVTPSRLGLAERLGRINEHNGCEVSDPWSVRSLGAVAFSQPAILDCAMAAPLDGWLKDSVQPAALRSFGESVVAVDVAASYSCRPRNNQRGARMSEHGFGNAIDIAAFTLASGRKVTVLDGWRGGNSEQRFLRQVHDQACADFHTVLGPDSGREHRNHLHLDLQNRRNESVYCR